MGRKLSAMRDACRRTPQTGSRDHAQVQREREIRTQWRLGDAHFPAGVAVAEEAGEAPGLGLVGIHREMSRGCGRPGGRRDRCSHRASARSRCRPDRRSAACAPGSSGAGSSAAATRGSARRRRIRRACRSGCSGMRMPLQETTWRSPVRPFTSTCMRSTELST